MQTTPILGMSIPSGDGDPFDQMTFVAALLKVDAAAVKQLAYAEFSADVSISAVTAATANAIVTTPSITLDGATPVTVVFFTPYTYATAAGNELGFQLYEGATDRGTLGFHDAAAASSNGAALFLWRRYTPAAGTYAFSIRGWQSGAGVAHVQAGAGGAGVMLPGALRVTT